MDKQCLRRALHKYALVQCVTAGPFQITLTTYTNAYWPVKV